eukprot:1022574-Alexandrium_andersonii.AAC.1
MINQLGGDMGKPSALTQCRWGSLGVLLAPGSKPIADVQRVLGTVAELKSKGDVYWQGFLLSHGGKNLYADAEAYTKARND